MEKYQQVLDRDPAYQNFVAFDEEASGVFYLTWKQFIQRFEVLGYGIPSKFRRFEDFDFSEDNEQTVVPPPLPNETTITLTGREDLMTNITRRLTESFVPGNHFDILNGPQGNVQRIRNNRAGEAFLKGIKEYFKFLRFIGFPAQFALLRNHVYVRLTNEDIENLHFNLETFASALYIAIQTGRKYAINTFVTSSNTIEFSEFVPRFTMDQIKDPRRSDFRNWPDFMKDAWSPVYWFYSLDEPFTFFYENVLVLASDNRDKYTLQIDYIEEVEKNLNDLLGDGVMPIISAYEKTNTTRNQFVDFVPRRMFNQVPAQQNSLTDDEMAAIFRDQEVRGIAEMYLVTMGRRLGANMGIQESSFLKQQVLESIQGDIEESDAYYAETLGRYEKVPIYDYASHRSGGVRFVQYYPDLMWEISLNETGVIMQSDVIFRILYDAYVQFKAIYAELHGGGMDGVGAFMNDIMRKLDKITITMEMRVENKLGQDVGDAAQGRLYEFQETEVFNWTNTVRYKGLFPVNFYNYLMEVVWHFWEDFSNYYGSYMNSFIYKLSEITVVLFRNEGAGGCGSKTSPIKTQFLDYKFITKGTKNNCFFKALEPLYDTAMMGRGEKLTLSTINMLRRRAGLKQGEAVKISDIPKMKFDFPFKIEDGNQEIIYENGENGDFVITLHEGHFFNRLEKVEPSVRCSKCHLIHPPRICRSNHAKFKQGKHKDFIHFGYKKHQERVKQGKVPMMVCDMETFPQEGTLKHIPYAVAFKVQGVDEYEFHENAINIEEGVSMFKGPSCVLDFLKQLTLFEKGCTIVFHNGSRYDVILLLEEVMMHSHELNMTIENLCVRNGKIMAMNIVIKKKDCPKVVFRVWDSCLHLLSSLKSACKIFKVPDDISKGDFDHTKIKNAWEDVELYQGEWQPYLRNDILALQYIVNKYEDEIIETLGFSPLHFITISSLAQEKIKKDISEKQLEIYIPKDYFIDDFFRKAVYGGRTVPVMQKYDAEPGDYMTFLDVKSLYPYAMDIGEFFVGEPRHVGHLEQVKALQKQLHEQGKIPPGIYRVMVKPPPHDMRYPIPFLPMREEKTNSLIWQYRSGMGHYSNIMLEYAVKLGYTFQFFEAYVFKGTTSDVFKTSNAFWQDMKNEAERVGNEGRRQIAKIANNSGYGKQIERPAEDRTLYTTKKEALLLMNQYGFQNVKVFCRPDSENCFVVIKERPEHPKTACHLGIVILDQSKIIMYNYFLKTMKPYGGRTLEESFKTAPRYSDTDSMASTKEQEQVYIESGCIGDKFGDLDYDLKDPKWRITEARFHAPKTYFFKAVHADTGKEMKKQRTKGFPDKLITYDQLMLASNTNTPISVEFGAIQRDVFSPNYKNIMSLRNTIMKRVLDLNCFKKCNKIKLGDQVYFVPFFDIE
jgi:DNA polymerase type B, organellar and viral